MIKPPTPGKGNTPDFQMKKEFIEKQLALKRYADDVERLALADIIRDPLVVHALEDYVEMYREQSNLRQIKNTIKNLYKIKRKNVDISPLLRALRAPDAVEPAGGVPCIRAGTPGPERQTIFRQIPAPKILVYSKDLALEDFKRHLRRIGSIRRLPIAQPTFARALSISTSHNHLIKKMEKLDSPVAKESAPRATNEITSATSFRNGVLKPASGAERAPRTSDASKAQNTAGARAQQAHHPEQFSVPRQEASPSGRKAAPQKKKAARPANEESAEKPKF